MRCASKTVRPRLGPGTTPWFVSRQPPRAFAKALNHSSFRAHLFRMRKFDSLSEREILALAISLEEEDERVYADFAEGLREHFPASAAVFDGMRLEESGH